MQRSELEAVADDPGLQLLNSRAAPLHDGARVLLDLITDGAAYLDWLDTTGLISADEHADAHRRFGSSDLDAVAAEAVALREWLRPQIDEWITDPTGRLGAKVVSRLNPVLALDRRFALLESSVGDAGPVMVTRRSLDHARALLAPPVVALASLLADADRSRVKRCESMPCTLYFRDRTKSSNRRWCSMTECGNREKARAHRARNRGGTI